MSLLSTDFGIGESFAGLPPAPRGRNPGARSENRTFERREEKHVEALDNLAPTYRNNPLLHIPYHRPSFSSTAAVCQPSSSDDLSPHEFILALLALVTILVLIYIFIFAFDCPLHRRGWDPSISEPSVASEASYCEIELASVDSSVKYQKEEPRSQSIPPPRASFNSI
ncbi:hypothetical protein VIGAN_01167600 [Vigna angularis var. angularis]|uniref:Uncharacterized protein n=1 Tax=Vigna angularis var. angularis TaxID=157739 RepID=A0A0S3R0H2_PHAAN|nr:hypothetical protein VIGAN_01167600 [Vigna angularis var. angularis]